MVTKRWCVWFLVSLGLCGEALCEELPDATATVVSSSSVSMIMVRPRRAPPPVEQNPRLIDDALYAGIAAYRTLDYLSTEKAMAHGAREVVLPQWVVNNHGYFITFEGLATVTEIGTSIWMIRHRHRSMARIANSVSIGLGMYSVANNYTQAYGPIVARP